jgi:hypothetical protein
MMDPTTLIGWNYDTSYFFTCRKRHGTHEMFFLSYKRLGQCNYFDFTIVLCNCSYLVHAVTLQKSMSLRTALSLEKLPLT